MVHPGLSPGADLTRLALEYFLFVFVAALGVLQGAATLSRLYGLSFFPRPWLGYLFAPLAIGGAYAWFFYSEDRNRPGIEGIQQTALFSLSVLSALGFTLLLSSLLYRRPAPSKGSGLEALRQTGYWQARRRGRDGA